MILCAIGGDATNRMPPFLFDLGELAGMPMDGTFAGDHSRLLVEVVDLPSQAIVFSLNVGRATPRCVVPFGSMSHVDTQKQVIRFDD